MATTGRILSRNLSFLGRQWSRQALVSSRSVSFIAAKKCNLISRPEVSFLKVVLKHCTKYFSRNWKIFFSFCQPVQSGSVNSVRHGGEWVLDLNQIRDRVMLVLKLYDKINPDTVSLEKKEKFCLSFIFIHFMSPPRLFAGWFRLPFHQRPRSWFSRSRWSDNGHGRRIWLWNSRRPCRKVVDSSSNYSVCCRSRRRVWVIKLDFFRKWNNDTLLLFEVTKKWCVLFSTF